MSKKYIRFGVLAVAVVTLGVVFAAKVIKEEATAANVDLLQNGGAATGNMTGWTYSDAVRVSMSVPETTGTVGPHAGSYFFDMTAVAASSAWMSQNIDVTGLDGQPYRAGGWIQTELYPGVSGTDVDDYDYGEMFLTFRDGGGALVDDVSLGPIGYPIVGLSLYEEFYFEGTVPTGAVTVEYRLSGFLVNDTLINVFYDDLYFKVDNGMDDDGDGYTLTEGDCDQADGTIYPGATEQCNSKDDDCDGVVDEDLFREATVHEGLCSANQEVCSLGNWVPKFGNYMAQYEVCDDQDNDCDGMIDEDLHQASKDNKGLCANNTQTCSHGWVNDGTNYVPVPELCDGLDNDCDGEVDEDLSQLTSNQQGACLGNINVCVASSWVADGSNYVPKLEDCNDTDDDCDGEIDENLTKVGLIQNGPCAGNTEVCVLGEWEHGEGYYEPQPEVCDGIDNDCDLDIDEDLTGAPASNQNGVCSGSVLRCDGVNGWVEPDYSVLPGFEETEGSCDGLDNDCDGETDNGLIPPPAGNQNGVCAGAVLACDGVNGWVEPDYSGQPGYEGVEITCDSLDNDCDGEADNNLTAPDGGKPEGVCAGSVQECAGAGGWQEPDYSLLPVYEETESSCDALDNDCDGKIDEDLSQPAEDQDGACAGNINVCVLGEWVPDENNYEPQPEVCDGVDNDCDPETVCEGIFSSLGFTADGVEMDRCNGSYILETDGTSRTDVTFSEGTLSDKDFDMEGLFLTAITGPSISQLHAYYNSHSTEPYRQYLKNAVSIGSAMQTPIAYVDGLGEDVEIRDGAVWEFGRSKVPMRIPGDYPSGRYTVATRGGEVTLTLFIDSDTDGVTACDDRCLGTKADVLAERLGVQRHAWNGTDWVTMLPPGQAKKNKGLVFPGGFGLSSFDMDDTQGCSCTQILGQMKGGKNGIYKFGCTKGILDGWIKRLD